MIQNVSTVRLSGLCVGCGLCAGICPKEAIQMIVSKEGVYQPELKDEECNKCGLCIRTCPGWHVDYNRLNMFCFKKAPSDPVLGNYLSCYIGHSTNEELRWKASSGGIVTTLLAFALREGIIDGAIVAVMDRCNIFRPKVMLARTEEEILFSMGSKYCPVPVGTAIKEILKHKGRFAAVGLPCHLHGIRKAEMLNEALYEKVVLHVGLFCSHTINFKGTECLLEKIRINRDEVDCISYRGRGWPGEMSVCLKNGKEKAIPYKQFWDCLFGLPFFTPWRCILCVDATSELSDISVGDPWLPGFKNERFGKSVIIARTRKAEALLNRAKLKGEISLSNMKCDHVKQSQMFNLKSKKRTVATHMSILKSLGKPVLYTIPPPVSQGIGCYLSSALTVLTKVLASHKPFSLMVNRAPFFVLGMYFKLLCAILLIS